MADIEKRCFQLIGDGHRKFWTVQVRDRFFFATWGKIGTQGQSQTKEFGSPYEAEKYAVKMISEKRNKGYVEVGSGDHPGAPAALLGSTRAGQEARADRDAKKAPAKAAKVADGPDLGVGERGIDL